MKRTLFITIMGLLLVMPGAKAQSIPNSSFENWTTDTIDPGFGTPVVFDHPVDWYPFFSLFNVIMGGTNLNLFETPDHYGAGSSALMIMTDQDSMGGDIYTQFPVSTIPQKLYGYYKYEGSPGVAAGISCIIGSYDAVNDTTVFIAGGDLMLGGFPGTYTVFELPIMQFGSGSPDSAVIIIDYMYDLPGSKLFIDHLSFDPLTSLEKLPEISDINLYPNPASDYLKIEWLALEGKEYEIGVFSSNGQMVWKGIDTSGDIFIPVSEFPDGTYIVAVNDGVYQSVRKIIKE